MATHNFFALLGDNENEDPAALIASYSASADQNPQPKKVQPPRVQHPAPSLPSKPPPPSEFVREARNIQGRGGRGSRQGSLGGSGQTDVDRENTVPRVGGENGYQGGRSSYQRGRSGYRGGGGGGRGGTFGGYGESVLQDKEEEDGRNFEGDRWRGRGQGRGRSFSREGNDQNRGGRRGGTFGGYGESVVQDKEEEGGHNNGGDRWRGSSQGRGRGFSREGSDQNRGLEYDRQSGSGQGYEVNRGGADRGNRGAGVEGTSKNETPEVGTLKEEEDKSHPEEKDEEQVKDAIHVDNGPQKEQEEEDKEMTLDEYEKVLEEKKKALSALKSEERKVKVDKSFQSMQLVDRKVDEGVFLKLGIDKEKGKKKEVTPKEDKPKKAVSINEFLKPANGENYTGGRGRGYGRGGGSTRGGFRGGLNSSPRVSAPQIEDPSQFPTLGGN